MLSQTDSPVLSCCVREQWPSSLFLHLAEPTTSVYEAGVLPLSQSRDEGHYVTQAGLELSIFQPPFLSSWYVRPAAQHPAVNLFLLLSHPETSSLGLEAGTVNAFID